MTHFPSFPLFDYKLTFLSELVTRIVSIAPSGAPLTLEKCWRAKYKPTKAVVKLQSRAPAILSQLLCFRMSWWVNTNVLYHGLSKHQWNIPRELMLKNQSVPLVTHVTFSVIPRLIQCQKFGRWWTADLSHLVTASKIFTCKLFQNFPRWTVPNESHTVTWKLLFFFGNLADKS